MSRYGSAVYGTDVYGEEWALPSITSRERFAPFTPRVGLRPGAGVRPYFGGASWAISFALTSILSSEAWGTSPGGGAFGGDLAGIPSGESWAFDPARPPHVGLHPSVGLRPSHSGPSWVNYSLPAVGIESEEEWGETSFEVLLARVYTYVALASALRTLVRVTS